MPTAETIPARRELSDIRNPIDRLFDELFTGRSLSPARLLRRMGQDEGTWSPDIDILETDDEILVYAALPGVDKKAIHVEVKDSTLVLRGERKPLDEKGKNVMRREQCYGPFYRAFSLSTEVDASKVKAVDRDGVVEIRLPKREDGKARCVSVD